jgi:hypothetical protein
MGVGGGREGERSVESVIDLEVDFEGQVSADCEIWKCRYSDIDEEFK